jgi:CrcB protein
LINVIAVAVGAMLGANARYWVGLWVSQKSDPVFPFGTLLINLTGSFLIGLLHSTVGIKIGIEEEVQLFAITGVLGAYTTYSTFSFETLTLARTDQPRVAWMYALTSVGPGVVLAAIGFGLGNWLGRVIW